MVSIVELPGIVNNLSEEDKALFYRIFSFSECIGELRPPEEMNDWLIKQFGSVEAVLKQKIIRVNNMLSFEGSLFNELRAKRPMAVKDNNDLNKTIEDNRGDPFCHPETGTPEDVFGRIKGQQSITASNVAKYDAMHGLVIFNEHNPLIFDAEKIHDYLQVALEWFRKAHETNNEYNFPFILWNCLWKSGASLIHGHMQTAITQDRHYMGIEKTKKLIEDYGNKYQADYYQDLLRIHSALGLAEDNIFCSITPIRDKETIIVENEINQDTARKINKVLQAFLKLGVQSFNIGIQLSPMDNSWHIPVIIRIVDRGDLNTKTTDMAGMELYAGQSVIPSDPYQVIEKIRSL